MAFVPQLPADPDISKAYSLQYAKISTSASGWSSVVAAVATKKIIVMGWFVGTAADVDIKFGSNTTDLTGAMSLSGRSPAGHTNSQDGCFKTAAGEALQINLSAAIATGGYVVYRIIDP